MTQGRWLLRHDWLAAFQQRAFEEVEEDPDRPGPDIAEYVAPLGSPRRPPAILLIRFCYLCSGPRRPGDVEDYFEQWAVVAGVLVIVDMLDLEVTPPIDLLDNSTQEEIRAKARTGWWHGGHGVMERPPCAIWSAALFQPLPGGGGPAPYRTRDHLLGLPALSGTWAQRCLDGSRILVFVLEILRNADRAQWEWLPAALSLPGAPQGPGGMPLSLRFGSRRRSSSSRRLLVARECSWTSACSTPLRRRPRASAPTLDERWSFLDVGAATALTSGH